MSTKPLRYYLPWILAATVSILAIYVWGSTFRWHEAAINSYQFFPLLGLLGFSIMWSHYVVGFLKENVLKKVDLSSYFKGTEFIVLLCIVLHPGILIFQRFKDGYGLPPKSYETYVAPPMAWITLLGTVCLLIFLAFELHRWFGQKRWWKYVLAAGDAAMLGIAYHGLRLGSQLQGGWYHTVWLFYAVVLLVILIRKYVLAARHEFQSSVSI